MSVFDASMASRLAKNLNDLDRRMASAPWYSRELTRDVGPLTDQSLASIGGNGSAMDREAVAYIRNNLWAIAYQLEAAVEEIARLRGETP
jgi:hypothetical protein